LADGIYVKAGLEKDKYEEDLGAQLFLNLLSKKYL